MVSMKRSVLAVAACLLLILTLCSWGPITHNSLAHEIADQASDYTWSYRTDAFYSGCIAPDIALAANPGTWDARQSLFHDGAYVDTLKVVAGDNMQKIIFVRGYEVHLICDQIESSYTAMKKAPVSSDFGVDRLIGSGSGGISSTYQTMMLQAWQIAYPSDGSVTAGWISKAASNFGFYMSGIYNPVSQADAEKYFSDYRAWYDQSVTESVAFLKGLNAQPEPPPAPEPTIEPPQNPMVMPYHDSGIRLRLEPLGNVFVSMFRWFFSLCRR